MDKRPQIVSLDMFQSDSPCVSLCKLEEGVCVGCGRTGRDVGSWQVLSDKEKAMVNQAAKARLSLISRPVANSENQIGHSK
jgi:predicted Fe-S protein YdhL (DUF1289 family)